MASFYAQFKNTLLRKKPIERTVITETRLDRCLSTFDLTTLGIGSTLGLGVYVLAGQVASVKAGPAVTVSFFIAAVASVFAGLCYAEFGARVPKSGSAYVYSYITVGEFMAFVIGWNLILEYAIGSASIARGYSGYVDSLFNKTMQRSFQEWAPLNFGTSDYFDFMAFAIAMLVAVLLSGGVKKSTNLNAFFTLINVLGVIYAMIVGSFKLDLNNWKIPESQAEKHNGGVGGFFPYGFSGLMAGAATCFYGFIGFDMIATTGEEVKNPSRSIPLSIVYSLLVIFVCYCGVSAVQTLMWPYYDQNQLAPLPYVFHQVGYPFAGYILTAGAMAGLYSSLLGTMYPLTRVLYAMGHDRVIFSFFSSVNQRFKTPLWATLFSGVFSGFMAALFEFQELADMMSIGTLLAYTLVSVSVLILRYQKRDFGDDLNINESEGEAIYLLNETHSSAWRKIFNIDKNNYLTAEITHTCRRLVVVTCFLITVLVFLLGFLPQQLYDLESYALGSVLFTLIVLSIAIYALSKQPQTTEKMSFKVPGVPLVPLISVFINLYLMFNLSNLTWIRFAVWMIIGMIMYTMYGMPESIGYLSDADKRKFNASPIVYPAFESSPTPSPITSSSEPSSSTLSSSSMTTMISIDETNNTKTFEDSSKESDNKNAEQINNSIKYQSINEILSQDSQILLDNNNGYSS